MTIIRHWACLSELRELKELFACEGIWAIFGVQFSFNLNQGYSRVGTHGNGVPTPLFLALHPCPWVIYSASKIESVAVTTNFSALNVQSTPNTSSLKVLNVETHVFVGCYSVVRWSLCWRGETGDMPQTSLSHQWLLSLRRDGPFKNFCTRHEWNPAKVLPIGPRAC